MLTPEDKQLIAEYMGWLFFPSYNYTLKALVGKESVVFFDLNDAGLCVQEIQKRGDWNRFLDHGFNSLIDVYGFMAHNFIATLFRAENFFGAMAAWIKERKSRY